jgi:hypothetical protein
MHTYVHSIHIYMQTCMHAYPGPRRPQREKSSSNMQVHMYTCINAHIHTHIQTCMHTQVHQDQSIINGKRLAAACKCTYIHACMHTYIHTCEHVCMHTQDHEDQPIINGKKLAAACKPEYIFDWKAYLKEQQRKTPGGLMSFLRVGDASRVDATSTSSVGHASGAKVCAAKSNVRSDEDDSGDQPRRGAGGAVVKSEDQMANVHELLQKNHQNVADTRAVDAREADRRDSDSEHMHSTSRDTGHATPGKRKRETEESDHIRSGHLSDQDSPVKEQTTSHTPADSKLGPQGPKPGSQGPKSGSQGEDTSANQPMDSELKQEGTTDNQGTLSDQGTASKQGVIENQDTAMIGNQAAAERQMCASEMRMRELIARDKAQGKTPAKSAKDAGKKAKSVKSPPQGNIQSFFVKK